MARGFVYLTAAVDVASRCVLVHKVAITLETVHAREVIEQAFARYGVPEIVNTDQGGQFTAIEFTGAVLPAAASCRWTGAAPGVITSLWSACDAASNTNASTLRFTIA